jgi:hypothetical protein
MSSERYEAILKEKPADEKRLVAEITASLETAMSVQPSADFLAHVRGRVAEERARTMAVWPAWLSGAAAAVPVVLAVIGAVVLGRLPPRSTDSDPAPSGLAAPTTVPGPPSGVLIPSVSSTSRHRPGVWGVRRTPQLKERARIHSGRVKDARAAGERAQRKRVPEADVLVEPGQPEALARLVALGLGALTLPPFVVESLDPGAPLPELRPVELLRFEAKPLEMGSSGWENQRWEAGDAASDRNEGSDS